MSDHHDDDRVLITAYVDGVTELSPDERSRVEAVLARDPDARALADATRGIVDQLRAIEPPGTEPDWRALELAIDRDVANPARQRRWAIPLVATLTAAAAVFAVVASRSPAVDPVAQAPTIAATRDEVPPPVVTAPVWLDGEEVGLDEADAVAALEQLSLSGGGTESAESVEFGEAPADGFGSWSAEDDSTTDSFGAQLEGLDDAALDRVEHWLATEKAAEKG